MSVCKGSRYILYSIWTFVKALDTSCNGHRTLGSVAYISHSTWNVVMFSHTPHMRYGTRLGLIRRESRRMEGRRPPWPESASGIYRPSNCCLSAKLVPTFADRGCQVVSVTDPYARNLAFIDRGRYFLCQVAPQLYSGSWVDPVPDPLLLRKSGSAGNRTQIQPESRIWCVPFVFSLIWFSWTFIMAYSKTKLKRNAFSLFQKSLDRKIMKQMFLHLDFIIHSLNTVLPIWL
jgi:hypothetical protein